MNSSPYKRRRISPSSSIAVTGENTDLASLPQNGASTSRRRSSFMSPTKASLARFHPSLLPQAKLAESPEPISKETQASIEQESVEASGKNGTAAYVAGSASKALETGVNSVQKRRRGSQSPGEGNASVQQTQYVMNTGPRASPPEEARDEGTPVNSGDGEQQQPTAEAADIGSNGITVVPDSQIVPDSQKPELPSTPTQRGPHVPTSGMGVGQDGEPSLPSTPTQLGLEPPRERSKVQLSSSPISKSRRKGRSSAKSSPLKPPDAPPEQPNQKQKSLINSLGPRRYIANTPKPPSPPEEAYLLEIQSRLIDLEKQLQKIEDKALQQLLVSTWQQEGSKEVKETAKQKKDVIQRSTKIVQLRDEVLELKAAQNVDHGQVRPEAIDQEAATTRPTTLTQRIAKFLPFSMKSRPPEPRPPSPKNKDIDQVPNLDLPQIAAAPFTTATTNTSLLPSTEDGDLLQRQDVILSAPQRLLTCDIQLTASVTTQEISRLDIEALSSWAEPELGSWLRQSREKMELAALGRAFGRYWEAARLRGKCWIGCTQDFRSLVANAPESNSPLLYLGMQDLVFARSNVQLKVTWRISLSEQGEVESHSSALPRFPAAWRQGANGELAKIGEAFLLLVEDRGISEAIGMICKVVFPT